MTGEHEDQGGGGPPAEFVDPRNTAETPRVRYFVQLPSTSNEVAESTERQLMPLMEIPSPMPHEASTAAAPAGGKSMIARPMPPPHRSSRQAAIAITIGVPSALFR